MKKLFVSCLLLCLLLSACVAKRTATDLHEDETHSIGALLFRQEDITEVLIPVNRTFSGNVCVVTNEEEKTAILEKLYDADISDFVDAELTGIMGASVSFLLRTENDESDLRIISDSETQYIVITSNDTEQICKKGPVDSFAFEELNQLVADVMGNEDDIDYAGTVTLIESGFESAVNKGNSAYARGIMDVVIAESGTVDAYADDLYDIEFEVCGTLYGINSETGLFYRNDSGEIMYAQLESPQLMQVKVRLGILSATP